MHPVRPRIARNLRVVIDEHICAVLMRNRDENFGGFENIVSLHVF